ncbi:indole-3-glycerol phosphate synthase TrpC [Acidianus sp. HS-5]|uniref:indole-3-glycerol phosphate synthase TrpC n=1 Tax=Acidianus sp. HS-5 TaxID=2886040 RepID=UPI001F17F548|nr:indole-3-glycerol phosphate synthase TrpC [Acidianus sp. HS-5]
MVRFLTGWLRDVVNNAYKRPYVEKVRDRPIFPLINAIRKAKEENMNPIIAEYKRASPSGFSADRNPIEYVKEMESSGAVGISVLTEDKFFSGSYDYLFTISHAVKIPILMKDFIVTEKQIDNAYNLGADSILLIVRILTERELESLILYARSYKLEPLVEIFDESELDIALNAGAKIIGVNSRDLFTFNIDQERVKRVLQKIPASIVKVAESGINSREQIDDLKKYGADAFLIGSFLMKEPSKIKELI